jgi:hypothetical protein
MMILSECHLTLYDTVDCVADPFDKQAKPMMHGDEVIGVDELKELDPGPSSHDRQHP